jgi:predicted HicB family RNase H-like nuclease
MKDVFDGFTVNMYLDEDEEYTAYFLELRNVSASGASPEEAIHELEQAWELMKEDYRASGEPIPVAPSHKQYSGNFNIRIDKRVHRSLAIEAAQSGISLNALIAQKLAQSIRTGYIEK